MNTPQLNRIELKLKLARKVDKNRSAFGAQAHRYKMGDSQEKNEVQQFEDQYGIDLPDGFKDFILRIGNKATDEKNCSAGPYYGIYELGKNMWEIADPALNYLSNPPYFDENMSQEEWDSMYKAIPDDISDDDFDKLVAKIYGGILIIGHRGCSGYIGLFVTGKDKGKVVYLYSDIEYQPHFPETPMFLDWYENWLDSVIFGRAIMSASLVVGKESEIMEWYLDEPGESRKLYHLKGLRFMDGLSRDTLDVLSQRFNSSTGNERRLLLEILFKNSVAEADHEVAELLKTDSFEGMKTILWFAGNQLQHWSSKMMEIIQHPNEYQDEFALLALGISRADLPSPDFFHPYQGHWGPEKQRIAKLFLDIG